MDNDNFKSLELVNGIPDFIVKLYKMLMETIGEVVSWSETGNSFVILDILEFTKNLLPSHFKHGNFASFVRQLNKYGFHKVKTDDSKKVGAQTWEFCHSNFRNGQPQLLSQIKRKTAAKTEKKESSSVDSLINTIENSSDVSLLKSQVKYLENVQSEMSSHLKSLTLQYQQILEKMSEFRHTISTQEQSLSSSLNSGLFRQVSAAQIPIPNGTVNLNSIMRNQFEFGQSAGNSINASFKSVPDPLYLSSQPLGLNVPPQTHEVADLVTPIASTSTILPSQPQPTTSAFSNVVPRWSAPPKVLLVEDDDTCRRLSSKLLQIFGCNFDIAVDGLDAVNRMNVGSKYDLVLMDIMMPNLDGVSATTRIRQFDQFTPIISMTSNNSENDCMTYLANGINDILVKPFNKSTLLGMIKRHCADRIHGALPFSDLGGKITDISAENKDSLGQIDSQLLGLISMGRSVPHFISPDPSFLANKKVKLSFEGGEELEEPFNGQ